MTKTMLLFPHSNAGDRGLHMVEKKLSADLLLVLFNFVTFP
jgi:hypothetical protein